MGNAFLAPLSNGVDSRPLKRANRLARCLIGRSYHGKGLSLTRFNDGRRQTQSRVERERESLCEHVCFASERASAFSLLFLFKFFFLSVSLLLLLFICGENRFSCDDVGGFFFFFFGGEKSLKAFENQLWLRWMRYGRCLCFVEKTREGF